MKKILLFFAALLPMLASADNYFVDGACWKTEISGHDGSTGQAFTCISETKICGDTIIDGVSALKVYENDKLYAIIRVDGDKVYAQPYKDAGNQWRLAYDFSMKEGDVCEIGWFDGYIQNNRNVDPYYVKCVSISPNENYGGWPTIHFEMYYNPNELTEQYYLGQGEWLIGIGSVNGVHYNHFTDEIDGGGGRHLSYELNGEVICQYSPASLGQAVAASTFYVSIDGLAAAIAGAEPGCEVRAYSADGSLAASAITASDGHATLSLPHKGLYLIAAGSASAKALVR